MFERFENQIIVMDRSRVAYHNPVRQIVSSYRLAYKEIIILL